MKKLLPVIAIYRKLFYIFIMKYIFQIAVFIILFLASLNAYAQPKDSSKENWILISSDSKQEIYYDSASAIYSKSGDDVKAWVKFVYGSPRAAQGYEKLVKHSVVLFRFDCSGNRFMYDKTYLYFVDNTEESYEHFLTWKFAEKGTASEVILNKLCDAKNN